MKKKFITPVVAAAVLSLSLFGCASSSETTAMDETTTMSETQTMAGETEMETTEAASNISLTNTEEYDEMFKNVSDTKQYDLIALAKTSPNLSTFAAMVEAAGIASAITPDKKFTIFAPTNEAFSAMPRAELDRLMKPENKAELIKVLQLHILPNEVASTRFTDNQRIKAGEDMYINIEVDNARGVTVGGANVIKPDVMASNGVLHVVDGVITTTSGTTK
ncbi:fasciclin domain-containing protein [Pontibacter cellulosilyticus]|uniref:Fasciclin domain-containing protein n=1 Tax=Pontibacter cellulosilyticus TaxID=1720253 RepID=A0A923SJE1_9BACT|nr:fasciclin domain-containing protein [Pontibacter cellulosilyticus]MBC5993562.1 fasciclin domain-containing protein [Pontibacter cellulosilyticus]